jgi:hypothetical protein
MGSDLREAAASTGALTVAGVSTSLVSLRGADLRVLRDFGAAAFKPSVFNKAARLAGAGGNGIDET